MSNDLKDLIKNLDSVKNECLVIVPHIMDKETVDIYKISYDSVKVALQIENYKKENNL